jgi:hypothetical protein
MSRSVFTRRPGLYTLVFAVVLFLVSWTFSVRLNIHQGPNGSLAVSHVSLLVPSSTAESGPQCELMLCGGDPGGAIGWGCAPGTGVTCANVPDCGCTGLPF